MTAFAGSAPPHTPRLGRAALWLACLALVLALHVAAFLRWNRPTAPEGETITPPAMLIDLTPAPAPAPEPAPQPQPATPAEPPPPQPAPPQPEEPQPPAPPLPPEPAQPVPPEPAPPLPALPEPPAPLPPPPRPTARHPARPVQRALPPKRVEPAAAAPPAAPAAAAPAPATPSPAARPAATPSGSAAPSWERALLAHIARFKHYPPDAERRGWSGVAVVRFALRRDGSLVAISLLQSSGHASLDDAATESIRRAAPLPSPPESVPGQTITLDLPLRFSLDGG
jgi:periplasmic protein TonB